MITAQPGAQFEPFLTGAPTGLEGTLTFRLIDPPEGTVVIAETTVGVTESAAGTYTFAPGETSPTAPTEQGTYLVVWRNPTPDPDVEATEELVVSYDAILTPDHWLTTLDRVRSQLQKSETDTGQDDVIEQVISSASWTIIQRYGKFRPAETGTKKFTWDGGHRLNLFPFFLRSASAVVLDSNETTTTPLDSSDLDYELYPRTPLDGVYRHLRLPNHQVAVGLEREVSVTGNWGYADGQVPPDVEQACIITVVEWMRRGVQAFGTGFTEEDAGLAPAGLPMAAKRLLAPYDRWGQG